METTTATPNNVTMALYRAALAMFEGTRNVPGTTFRDDLGATLAVFEATYGVDRAEEIEFLNVKYTPVPLS